MATVDTVADVELRQERTGKFKMIKHAVFLLFIAFGVTQDRMKTIIITLFYLLAVGLFG